MQRLLTCLYDSHFPPWGQLPDSCFGRAPHKCRRMSAPSGCGALVGLWVYLWEPTMSILASTCPVTVSIEFHVRGNGCGAILGRLCVVDWCRAACHTRSPPLALLQAPHIHRVSPVP